MKRAIQLDALRGVAIVLAMGWHLNAYSGNFLFDLVMLPGREVGWAGVDLFFVLSGFLVGQLILVEIRETSTFNYGRFLIRRAFRLWPLLYMYLLAQLLVGNKPASTFFWQTLFHVQNYFHTPLAGLWSLAVEEHFYLAAGIVLPWAARKGATPATYVKGLTAILVLSLLFRCIGVATGATSLQLQTYTHFRADALACGVLLAVLAVHYRDFFLRLTRPKPYLFAAGIAGLVTAALLRGPVWGDTLGYVAAYLGSAALLLASFDVRYPAALAWGVRVLAFLGLYSYALYIWHFPIAMAADKIASTRLGIGQLELLMVVRYGAAIVVAYIVAKLVERPMIALRDRMFPSMLHRGLAVGGEDMPTALDLDLADDKAARDD